jgi:signal transduction histidine kinase
MSSTTAENYAAILSQRMAAERLTLAGRWLGRLKELLTVADNDVFPSDHLLDHIPLLISEIATYLRAPADEEIAANTAVIEKARELGALRHEQRASVHQLLREYEILGEILQGFLIDETSRLGLQPSSRECFEVFRRLTHAAAALMRTTVETFISEYTATIQDQSERLKAFNRSASHELRSSIGTMLFAAGILEKDRARLVQNEDRLAKVASTVRSTAERLLWLVENLQRIAKLSDSQDAPSQQWFELDTIASEVVRQLSEMADSRGVSVRIGSGLPAIVADPARVELVLLNLVSNGIKYSNPRKAEPYVEIAPANQPSPDPARFTIVVRDNGIGIPDADREAVFERFFRAHAHLDRELGVTGSGLGLAIVSDCVDALGGSIRCESSPENGTAFYITIPVKPAAG